MFTDIIGFQWDDGNLEKNWLKHHITNAEAEQVLFNKPLVIAEDQIHSSTQEQRWVALGQTNTKEFLTIIFTIRKQYIRIISARSMSKKERNAYEKNT
ncbi:MAG: BrnT family toxin [Patescibacteria group bacterium]|jgi:hypothetical protein